MKKYNEDPLRPLFDFSPIPSLSIAPLAVERHRLIL
jgi:hypothetical protein